MNRIFLKIFFLLLITGLASCKKFIDVTPTDQVTDNIAWTSTSNADLFLNNIYASIAGPPLIPMIPMKIFQIMQ